MSDKSTKLEEIIESTLAEAKKRSQMAMKKHHEEEEEEEEEDYPKHSKKHMKEANHEEDEDEEEEMESGKYSKKKRMKESASLAASSLKPKSRPSDEPSGAPKSGSDTNINKFNETLAQFGPGKDYGVGDKSAQNQSSIDMKTGKGPKTRDPMPKLNVKEDIEAMFVGEELTEEFKEKASTLFEAAVNARVVAEVSRIEEQYENAIAEELQIFTEEIVTKLDAYLDYVVENWMEENEVAIESTLRNEIMEEFIDGLKGLFTEHYVNMPENKIDIVEELANKVEELETNLDEVISENTEMKEIISDVAMREIFEDLSSDLVISQKEKFLALCEGIEFDGDVEIYEKKLRIIKETYFNNENVTSNIQEETFEGDLSESVSINPVVNRYVQALTRTVKK